MKPFIFQFKETATEQGRDYSNIQYSEHLNLNVDTATGAAAIECVNLETETFTKEEYEGADVDRNHYTSMLETETRTFTQSETSDSDHNRNYLDSFLETSTHTRTDQEVTDSDRN